jgi:hypothetical protein
MSMSIAAAAGPESMAGLLPDKVSGWRPAGPDELADRDGLFKLINGGAEVYRSLNVRRVFERRYSKPEAPDLLADLYDMGSSADAFGAYHHDMREGQNAGVGQESERQGGNVHFWKGSYFVSVVAMRKGPGVTEGVLALAKAIASRIPESGHPPDLAGLLPAQGLVQSQVHYFHDWMLFSRHTYLADKNFLNLSDHTEGLLARYQLAGEREDTAEGPALLLVRYPDEDQAQAAENKANQTKLDQGRSLHLHRRGRLLLGVIDAPSIKAAEGLLSAIPTPGKKGAKR